MGLTEREASEVFYVSLLLHVGCMAYSHETNVWFGDDAAVHRGAARTTNTWEIFTVLIPEATRDLSPRARLKSVALFGTRGPGFSHRHDMAACEAARAVARRIGLPDTVSAALYDVHEWWNGRGARGLRGDAIAQSARIARVATDAVFLAALGDPETVTSTLRRLGGKRLDPAVVADRFRCKYAVGRVLSGDPRTRILEVEPAPTVEIEETDLAEVAAAFGDLADIKISALFERPSLVANLVDGGQDLMPVPGTGSRTMRFG